MIFFIVVVGRSGPADIRQVLVSYQGRDIAKEFIERSKEHQRLVIFPVILHKLWYIFCFLKFAQVMNCCEPAHDTCVLRVWG